MRRFHSKRLLIVLAGIAALAAAVLNFKQRDSYRCQVCFSTRSVFRWRIGAWPEYSIPMSPKWQELIETQFARDFLSADHKHDWMYAQGSPYYWFGTKWGGCAIGSGRHVNDLCQIYESDRDFRTFVQARLRNGSLTKSNIVALFSVKPGSESPALRKDTTALLDEFNKQ